MKSVIKAHDNASTELAIKTPERQQLASFFRSFVLMVKFEHVRSTCIVCIPNLELVRAYLAALSKLYPSRDFLVQSQQWKHWNNVSEVCSKLTINFE